MSVPGAAPGRRLGPRRGPRPRRGPPARLLLLAATALLLAAGASAAATTLAADAGITTDSAASERTTPGPPPTLAAVRATAAARATSTTSTAGTPQSGTTDNVTGTTPSARWPPSTARPPTTAVAPAAPTTAAPATTAASSHTTRTTEPSTTAAALRARSSDKGTPTASHIGARPSATPPTTPTTPTTPRSRTAGADAAVAGTSVTPAAATRGVAGAAGAAAVGRAAAAAALTAAGEEPALPSYGHLPDLFQRSKLEGPPSAAEAKTEATTEATTAATEAGASTPAPAHNKSLTASTAGTPPPATPTMSLFNLADNLIGGFAVMVLQSQVHVDEPAAAVVVNKDKEANLLEDMVFKPEPMRFVTANNTVVVAQRGTTAFLPCVIKNIADGLVTWLRRRDHHLLTVARGGYAQDDRFQVVHDQHPEDWTMQLKFVTDRDTGRYECQVSTHPPVSIYIHLKVVEARCVVEGPAEKFVRAGSQLRLVCHIDQCTTEPEFMFWYKDGIMVNYDIDNVYKVTVDLPNNTTVLVVDRASRAHSGNYTCEAQQAVAASNYVHVISGENPAAMQTGGVGVVRRPLWLLSLLAVRSAAGAVLG